tara:strand:- start:17724 stop:17930 length:207 start_codon:yes stop_codon:yes gene_type:complete
MLKKIINFITLKNKKTKKQENKRLKDINDNIQLINSELLNLKIYVENELELYVMRQFVNDVREQNMLN